MEMSVIISQMAVLFLILAVGYGANKLKIMSAETDKLLSRLILTIVMPCTILSSVMGDNLGITGSAAALFMLMALATFVISFLFALPLPRLMRCAKSDRGMYAYMIAFANVGFMGFPITGAIFGDVSAFFVALYNIPFTVLAFSVGIIMVSEGKGRANFRVLINPSLISVLVVIVIFITGFKTPSVIAGAIKLIGSMTTPCAMLIIGSTLAGIPFRDVFSEPRLYIVTAVKLIIIPVVTWLVLKPLISDTLILGILVTLSAMPTATTATMLAMQYGGNEKLASKGIFITTLLSVVTIPLVVLLLLT